jgi:hypothetical protein
MKINPYLQNTHKTSGDLSSLKNDKSMNARSAGLDSQLKEMGVSSSADMQAAYKIYRNANQEPTKTMMSETQKFFDKSAGTSANKLLTVQVASAKGVDITTGNLTDIHAALNDQENASMTLENLLKDEFKAAESTGLSEKELQEAGADVPDALKKEVYSALKEMGYSEKEAVEIGDRLIAGESIGSILADQHRKMISEFTGDAIKKLDDKALKRPQNLVEALLMLEGKLKITLFKMKMNVETTTTTVTFVEGGFGADQLSKILGELVNDVEDLAFAEEEGKAVTGNENTTASELSGATETEIGSGEAEEPALASDHFLGQLEGLVDNALAEMMSAYGSADLQAMFESKETKAYLVTEVTVRMVTVKKNFDVFKKDALASIDQALEANDSKSLAEVAVKVAEKLDKLIMQSDLTLYTDMKTERKLIGISSDLQKVSTLAQNNPQEAVQWLKETKKKLDKLLFQPSKERVQVFMKEDSARLAGIEKSDLQNQAGKVTQGAKPVLDLMRAMGLNHEVELMDAVFSSELNEQSEKSQNNLKQIMLKLAAEDHEDQQHLVKSIEKGLSQLTGQQLLNKTEPQNDTQSLFFNLPIKFGDDMTHVKLYVKSRKSVEKMDWENCSMYLLVDLKQYGETGIRIQSSQRQLSVSISNASEDIMDVIKPFTADILSELKEIGYNPGEIKYVPFTKENETPSELPKVSASAILETGSENIAGAERKGFEIKI